MTAYLSVDETDYVSTGITITNALIIRASSIIDAHCKRELSVKSYTERVPLTEQQKGHLSYYPVVNVTELKARPKYGLTGDNFFGPPQFETIDLSALDVDKNIGAIGCVSSAFGVPFTELEVTYTSGWEPIPEKVKVACGLIINQQASNPNSNVKSKKDYDFSIEYFGSNLITSEIEQLLNEFVLRSFR